ncbi:LOW QUALITY PROTEIN: apolipoprotein A-II [Acanthochromis polyacanthus]|uniref:LOW QUALITY PROTEIN: apolipoprotein A-II n=1 Tax=Acanthochromis polyacanthus TaxID=80966 RepID=UPI0022344A5E|nr:LOW QUALITY PROTEIN: apolipoprotein A-II [Acanthochromis polyacanthus]
MKHPDMNAKIVIALILALQVSTSLCEVPTPSDELVQKYDQAKARFIQRLVNAYKRQGAIEAQVGADAAVAEEKVEELKKTKEFEAVQKVLQNIGTEVEPYLNSARSAALGGYEKHVRPQVGSYLSDALDVISKFLDGVMPAQ